MGPQGRDYYEILGVERTADAEEIRRAYRKLARQHHPDVNRSTEAEALFKELNEAYQVLSDPEKRATYDRFGRVDVADWSRGFGVDPFADIFEDFFGGFAGSRARRGRKGPMPGADL
ncbi:MAG: DnaJ domain-containing protein, partial [Chloroflexota bacterium]|nr:DnaJ domain-containing protein [Chloroflexota bacterium]